MFSNVNARPHGGSSSKSSRSRSAGQPKTFRGRTRPNLPLSSKYKTEMCHYLAEQGRCPFEDQCTYAHSEVELRHIDRHPKHKTLPCRDFSTVGFCPFGERCSFIHHKRDPDDILRNTNISNQKQKNTMSTSFYPSQEWSCPLITLNGVPASDSGARSGSYDGNTGSASRSPSPWSDMGYGPCASDNLYSLTCGEMVTEDFLQVPGSVAPKVSGTNSISMSSPNSSSGFSGATFSSKQGSNVSLSAGSLSRSSSTSDLSDIGAGAWPAAQLHFPAENVYSGPQFDYAQESCAALSVSQCSSKSGQRLPVFQDISLKDNVQLFNFS